MNQPNHTRYDRLSAAGLFYLLLGAVLVIYASTFFYSFNTGIEPFDDEGFFLISLRDFAGGRHIFEEFYTIYGPVHYLYLRAVFAMFRLPFDQEGLREAALFSSLLVTGLFSAAAYKFTGKPVLAAAAGMFIGKFTESFGSTPGHPGEAIWVIIATFVFFLSSGSIAAAKKSVPALAAAAACVFLCKINLGLYLAAAALTYAAWRPARGSTSPALFFLIASATALLPLALAGGLTGRPEQLQYLVSIEIGFLLTIAAAFSRESKAAAGEIVAAVIIFSSLIGAAAGLLIISGIPAKIVIWGLLFQHAGIWSNYELLPALDWSVGLLNAASIAVFSCRKRLFLPAGSLPFSALMYAAAELLLIFTNHPVAAFQFGLAFLWLPAALIRELKARDSTGQLMGLVFTAMFLSLTTYPRMLAHDWQVCLSILCIVATDLSWSGLVHLPLIQKLETRRGMLGIGAAAVMLAFLLLHFRIAVRTFSLYQPLNLPGSGAVRVEPEQARELRQVTAQIRAEAGTLFTVPGAASLNLWTGVPPPTGFNFTNWIAHFPFTLQQQIIAALRSADRPVVIWNEELLKFWKIEPPYPTSPLLEYIEENFCRTGGAGPHILLRPAANLAPGTICKRIGEISS